MKKFLISLLIILLGISGYYAYYKIDNKKVTDETPINTSESERIDNPQEEEKEEVMDNNPITLSLYKNYKGEGRKKMTTFESTWTYHNDISSFEVFFTNIDSIPSGNFRDRFQEYYTTYSNIENYRIGYILKFSIDNIEKEYLIKSPKDTEEYFNYLETYLYDDYHREKGVWYSHTLESEMNDETLLTSIKLTSGKEVERITSDITLTAFTYDKNNANFDINKTNSKYTITVKKA